MAYKEITSLDADTTIALGGVNRKTNKKNPTQVEGFFLGSRKVDSPKAKSGFAFIHVFQTSTGNVGVWGKTDMDRKLASAAVGHMTLVVFAKMKPTKNGDMYTYTVQQDADNAIDVSSIQNDSSTSNEEETSNDEGTDEVQEYSSSDADEDDAAQAAALAAAERKAKVQEMLRKGKGVKAS